MVKVIKLIISTNQYHEKSIPELVFLAYFPCARIHCVPVDIGSCLLIVTEMIFRHFLHVQQRAGAGELAECSDDVLKWNFSLSLSLSLFVSPPSLSLSLNSLPSRDFSVVGGSIPRWPSWIYEHRWRRWQQHRLWSRVVDQKPGSHRQTPEVNRADKIDKSGEKFNISE